MWNNLYKLFQLMQSQKHRDALSDKLSTILSTVDFTTQDNY